MKITETQTVIRLTETADVTHIQELPETVEITEVSEQGPPGPRGNDGGISTLEQAVDFDGTAKTNGSVIEYSTATGKYEAATPIADRQIHGGYF